MLFVLLAMRAEEIITLVAFYNEALLLQLFSVCVTKKYQITHLLK